MNEKRPHIEQSLFILPTHPQWSFHSARLADGQEEEFSHNTAATEFTLRRVKSCEAEEMKSTA